MISEKFADFILKIKYDELPENVIKKAKLCFLDFLGVTLRGSKTKSAQAVKGILKKGGGSTVIGLCKSTALDSAFANGIAAHSLDLDDGSRMAQIHPGACVIPAALALCEEYDKKGSDLITAIISGYEIAISLGIMVNPAHRNKGFHTTGTIGTFGAAAASSKILNLDKQEIINALGLAGTQASGLLASDHSGSMGKHLHAGKASQSGVLSAFLASRGFTGASNIIEADEGFLSSMTGIISARKHLELGKYHILNVYFKKYPVCRHLHSALDATSNILKDNDINNEDILEIIIKTYKIAASHDEYVPKTVEAIKQSLPLSVSIFIKNKGLQPNDLYVDNISKGISHKIFIQHDENMDHNYPYKRPSSVMINTTIGSYYNRIELPGGEPETPFSEYELLNKFKKLNPQLDIDIMSIINNLEKYNVKELMKALNAEFKDVE